MKNILRFFPKLKKRYWALLIVLALVLFWFFFVRGGKKVEPQFATVQKEDLVSSVSASGTLQGKDTATLKFKYGGILNYVAVKEGDTVRKGQVVASLDAQDLSIALQQSQNTLKDKQAIVDKIYDDLKDHSSDESLTQRQTRTTAEVARDNAYDSVRAAQRAMSDSRLISPLTGVVTQAVETAGQSVSAADTVAQVVDESSLYFDAEVDEADIGKVSVGQDAAVTLNSTGEQTFTGKVEKIIPATKTTSSGATIVIVRINLGNPTLTFVPGINGQAEIITRKISQALAIPQEALVQKDAVYIKDHGKIKEQKIMTGFEGDADIEVTDGLSEGEQVVKNPTEIPAPSNGGFLSKILRKGN